MTTSPTDRQQWVNLTGRRATALARKKTIDAASWMVLQMCLCCVEMNASALIHCKRVCYDTATAHRNRDYLRPIETLGESVWAFVPQYLESMKNQFQIDSLSLVGLIILNAELKHGLLGDSWNERFYHQNWQTLNFFPKTSTPGIITFLSTTSVVSRRCPD